MENDNKLSLSDSDILREDERLLNLLLKDQTTGENIKWATESYFGHGASFRDDQEITIDLITGWYEGFIRPRADKDLDIQLERQKNKAEVFTPSWIIKLQVDTALEDMKNLSLAKFIQTKWLEITCGEAPYMVNRYDMDSGKIIPLKERSGFIDNKFKRLNKEIDSEEEWRKLAFEIYKASYGYEYQGDSLLLARENLLLTFIDNYFYMFGAFPENKLILNISKIISMNVFQMDGLTYEVPYSDGGEQEFGTQLNLFEELEEEENKESQLARVKLWDKNVQIDFKKIIEGKGKNMKFDVVIGNPPYQMDSRGSNRNEPIYPYFYDAAKHIADKYCLITPARFLFNVGATNKRWNEKMLNDTHLSVLYYKQNSSDVFPNTDIQGGVAVLYRDSSAAVGPIGTFTMFDELASILDKSRTGSTESFSDLLYSNSSYKLTDLVYEDYPELADRSSVAERRSIGSNAFDRYPEIFKDSQQSDLDIGVYGRQNNARVYKWIDPRYINDVDNLYAWKVFVPGANGSGAIGEVESTPLIGQPHIGHPRTGHTQTFISFGAFASEFDAESCLKYLKSKFSRTLLGIMKVTQNNKTKKTWSKIPLQDFSENSDIDWTKSIPEIDQQLYKKYDLSEEEIEFIETHVKEME